MNCRDFDRIWTELFDAASSPAREPGTGGTYATELALREHAAGCSTCRSKAAGYEKLERSILAWGPPPDPAADLADRIALAAKAQLPLARPPLIARRRGWPSIRVVAAAASIVSIITFGIAVRISNYRSAAPGNPRRSPSAKTDGPKLNDALASATAASWDLARSASEPAARLSRQFLDRASESGALPADQSAGALSVPSLDALAPDSAAAAATIQLVGDRLADGVRPLSSSARQAFSFLFGPASKKPQNRANPPAARGA
jgi:hypothetical protein